VNQAAADLADKGNSPPDVEGHMCKAERLAVAGAIAPTLRSAPETVRNRRVAVVDKSGVVSRYTTVAKIQKSLLLARGLELEVTPETRPKVVVCLDCGRDVRVPPTGVVPSKCRTSTGCMAAKCVSCATCGAPLPTLRGTRAGVCSVGESAGSRELRAWKLSDVARELKVSVPMVSMYASGKVSPTEEKRARIAELLGIPAAAWCKNVEAPRPAGKRRIRRTDHG
jgi:hypothetical protein